MTNRTGAIFKTPGPNGSGVAWAILAAAIFLLTLELCVELFLASQHHGWNEVQATIPDEALFIEVAKDRGFRHFGAGYGPVFWFVLAQLLSLAPNGAEELAARTFFILTKYAAVGLMGFYLWRQGKRLAASLFIIAVVGSPGFMFMGKIISPEYQLLLLSALAACSLYADAERIGKLYFLALALSVAATLTKLSALPLLGMVTLYGLVVGYRRNSLPVFSKIAAEIVATLGLALAILVLGTWPNDLLADIKAALAIVPPLEISPAALVRAWRIDDVTWDQIKLGGIGKDFVPVFFLMVAGTVLLPLAPYSPQRSANWALYLSALAMLATAVFHDTAHTWYIFLPFFLFATVGANVIGDLAPRTQAMAFLLLVVVVFLSASRMKERIQFKWDRVSLVTSAAADANDQLADVRKNLSCAHTANVDILIPTPEIPGFDPARLALEKKSNGNWSAPDILMLNNSTLLKRSPLVEHVVQDQLSQYVMTRRSGVVDLYVKRDLPCFKTQE